MSKGEREGKWKKLIIPGTNGAFGVYYALPGYVGVVD